MVNSRPLRRISQILADGTVDDGSNTDELIGPRAIVPYPFGSLTAFADPIDQSVEGPDRPSDEHSGEGVEARPPG